MSEYTIGKQLEVRLHGRRVGLLHGAPGNGMVFQYDTSYVGFPGAIPLGTRSPLNDRPWNADLTRRWFDGLLPEGGRRFHLARMLGIVHVDTWSLLEAAGAECAGAVQVVPPNHRSRPTLFDLDTETLTVLLESARTDIPDEHRPARLSLAGAQDKIVLFREHDDAHWKLPVDGQASTHILKPDNPHFPDLVRNEHWCMEVARRAGFDTARTRIEPAGDKEVLVIERYDRTRDSNGEVGRIHQEDLAQALGSRTKYQDEGFPSTYDLAKIGGVDGNELFERLILNWLLGNCDAHAKNYSILEPGTPNARLAPLYDIVSTEAYGLNETMGTSIGNAKTLKTVTREAVEHVGKRLGKESPEESAADVAIRVEAAIGHCRESGIEPGPVPTERILDRIGKAKDWNRVVLMGWTRVEA